MNLCNRKIRRCSVHKTQSQREIGKRNTQSYAVATRLYTGTPKSLNSAESGYRVTCSTYTQTYTNRTILYSLCTRPLKRKPLRYTLSIKLRQIVDLSKLHPAIFRTRCHSTSSLQYHTSRHESIATHGCSVTLLVSSSILRSAPQIDSTLSSHTRYQQLYLRSAIPVFTISPTHQYWATGQNEFTPPLSLSLDSQATKSHT